MESALPFDERLLRTGATCDRIAGTLRMARALALNGREIALDGLDQDVGRLCAQALDLPPEDGRSLRPRLAGLVADLDALSLVMRKQDDAW